MTPEQYRLYTGMQQLFRAYRKGGAAWVGQRASGTTIASLASRVIQFMPNNRIAQAQTLPAVPIFTAPWWGLAATGVDIQSGDVYTNGSIAFLVTGAPDTSEGFQVIPCAPCAIPRSLATQAGAGFQAGLRIGAF